MQICLAIYEILANEAFAVTNDLISQLLKRELSRRKVQLFLKEKLPQQKVAW